MRKKNIRKTVSKPYQQFSEKITFFTHMLVHSESELQLGWHDEVEIIKIISGEGEYTISGRQYRVRAGSFILINSNQIHSARAYEGRPLINQSLKFNYSAFINTETDSTTMDFFIPLLHNEMYLPNTILTTFSIYKDVETMFDNIAYIAQKDDDCSQLLFKSHIYHLFYLFFKNNFVFHNTISADIGVSSEEMVKTTIEYIHANYHDEIPLDLLSEIVGTSKPHLCRIFKRMTNQTISEYQNNQRIAEACILLQTTNDQIIKVAFDVGYHNLSHFNSRFKQKVLITPHEFRKQIKKR